VAEVGCQGRIGCGGFTCDPGCFCRRMVEDQPFCADFSAALPCTAFRPCANSTECPTGHACVPSETCGHGICAPACGEPTPVV
jgi:hypothetical protein